MYEINLNGTIVKLWTKNLELKAYKQIDNLSSMPFVYHHLAFMPDVHAGCGMPIGGVLATEDVIIPNAVGVDIGCGMCAVKTDISVENISSDTLRKVIMRNIRKCIPLGMAKHKFPQDESLMPSCHDVDSLNVVSQNYKGALRQLGTLGGGNHFIELQKDAEGMFWVMIHSGSRHLGTLVGEHYNALAKKMNRLWYSKQNPDVDMPFLPKGTQEFEDYWNEMEYCIDYALCNRRLMMVRILEILSDACSASPVDNIINIAHNYAAFEKHFEKEVIVHRKGATRALAGEIGIIPGSQGTHSYIVEGLGNPESFFSCSHGAGRKMSRTEAINKLSLEDEIARLDSRGIVHAIRCKNDLEEAAGAYKDINEVMDLQSDLVKPLCELTPVAVVKGL